ncbi:phosphoribosylanthranilate isomerase [Nocardia rosealba]|uniref:phosphoribosylanthranilate isomerase n=1 Tax=Nocardia rosealba TaxID=2878563 RepID=UPI001CD98173|nr:phosphoribosylanthranilate isomerase [Nocardia rosealba]MCA2210534.1 phosphoribosylanthranilate isomerase [Nocardia rosealba]
MTESVQVKICGIRSAGDLRRALRAKPDAVGFICGVTALSEDEISAEEAGELSALVAELTVPVKRVLVTHLEDADDILALADRIGVDAIQVHGLVSTESLRKVYARTDGRREIIRAVHVLDEGAFADVEAVADYCDVILLDSRTPDRLGGTGQTHDWRISNKIVESQKDRGKRVVLAGGLDPDNVRAAIDAVKPFGVDVNSGVDDAEGDKSEAACVAFVEAAREAASTYRPAQQH